MATEQEVRNEQTTETTSKVSSKKNDASFTSFLLLLFLMFVITSIPFILIRLNILNAGDLVRPYIKSDSAFQRILPPIEDPNNIEQMNREELLNLAKEYKSRIDELEMNLEKAEETARNYTDDPDGFIKIANDIEKNENDRKLIEKERQELEQDKKIFYEQIVKEDMPQFKEYYEKMDADSAKELYTLVMENEKVKADIKEFITYFENMDSGSAAQILQQTANSNIVLVANILKYMEKAKASKIMISMDASLASRISSILAGNTDINK